MTGIDAAALGEDQLRPVYRERAQLLALIAAHYPAVLAYSDPSEPELPVLTLTTPAGQATWHLNPDDLDLFAHVRLVSAEQAPAWDGHTSVQKYQRLAYLVAALTTGLQHLPEVPR